VRVRGHLRIGALNEKQRGDEEHTHTASSRVGRGGVEEHGEQRGKRDEGVRQQLVDQL
jgi:hypothetical protein